AARLRQEPSHTSVERLSDAGLTGIPGVHIPRGIGYGSPIRTGPRAGQRYLHSPSLGVLLMTPPLPPCPGPLATGSCWEDLARVSVPCRLRPGTGLPRLRPAWHQGGSESGALRRPPRR